MSRSIVLKQGYRCAATAPPSSEGLPTGKTCEDSSVVAEMGQVSICAIIFHFKLKKLHLLFKVPGIRKPLALGDWDATVWVWQGAKPGSLSKRRSRVSSKQNQTASSVVSR